MSISTTILEASLQAKLDATTGSTEVKEFLLLGKAYESLVPSITVGAIVAEGEAQVLAVQNSVANLSSTDVFETRTADIDMNDNMLDKPEIRDYSETVQEMTANDVDMNLGNVQTKIVTGLVTFTFSNPPLPGKAGSFTLILTTISSPVITWPLGVIWANAVAPILSSAGIDIFTFLTTDGGTTWYGFIAGQGMS
jgi:hypothetical protein